MARKSNLVPDSVHKFDSSKQLTREKIVLNGDIVIVKFEWSKTIQFGKRVIQTPLVSIPGSALCPVTAFKHMCEMLPASEHSPAFLFPKGSGVVPVTYNVYNRYIKYFLNLIGLDNKLYSSHSFLRGGATLAFSSKVPSELIQIHGDWASDAYKIYLELSLKDKLLVSEYMTNTLLNHFR